MCERRVASPPELHRNRPDSLPPSSTRHARYARVWCCRNGADDAFLDDRTLARHLAEDADISDETIMRRYLDRVPLAARQNSCIFHGKHGCTLDRGMRADICNTYFCGGLNAYMRGEADPEPTVVLAGEGDKMRSSAVLIPYRV